MAIRKRILAWSAVLALIVVAASTLYAATIQRLLIPCGTSELVLNDRILVIQAADDVAISVTVDGDSVRGVLEKARETAPEIHVRISWKNSGVLVVDAEVDAPVEFSTSLRKETGHGEM